MVLFDSRFFVLVAFVDVVVVSLALAGPMPGAGKITCVFIIVFDLLLLFNVVEIIVESLVCFVIQALLAVAVVVVGNVVTLSGVVNLVAVTLLTVVAAAIAGGH